MSGRQELLATLPSVDEVLRSPQGVEWLKTLPRRYIVTAIRQVLDLRRKEVLEGTTTQTSLEKLTSDIELKIKRLTAYSLRPIINATGIVIHTNLGRSVLSERVMEHVKRVAVSYCNLEYDLAAGHRGKRHSHIKRLLREITGAEDGFAVNNNAAAVLLCLNTLARGREVIVSRGELVEIGGSFRIPDVMTASGAVLKEVGTTNKTHLRDYEKAVADATALVLKVHQSNYRISGFTEEVPIDKLVAFGHGRGLPVMYDLGSGCLIDLRQVGIHSEPTVREMVAHGVDILTFSGDKLLGGPQAGVIVGRREFIERIQENPLARAVRIDKLSLAALEATLMEYADEDRATDNIPTLKMILEDPDKIKGRAKKVAALLRRTIKDAVIDIREDSSQAGGGALPEKDFKTYSVWLKPERVAVHEMEDRLRNGEPPVIARIKEGCLVIDARTVSAKEVPSLVKRIRESLQ